MFSRLIKNWWKREFTNEYLPILEKNEPTLITWLNHFGYAKVWFDIVSHSLLEFCTSFISCVLLPLLHCISFYISFPAHLATLACCPLFHLSCRLFNHNSPCRTFLPFLSSSVACCLLVLTSYHIQISSMWNNYTFLLILQNDPWPEQPSGRVYKLVGYLRSLVRSKHPVGFIMLLYVSAISMGYINAYHIV